MHTNEENKLSKEGLLKLIEGHLGFFKRKGFWEAEAIAWRMSELSKLPGRAYHRMLKEVFLKLNEAASCYHQGHPATKKRLTRVEKALEEAISKAEEEAAEAEEVKLPKTPTWPYGLPPLEEPSPPEYEAPWGSHGR